MATFGFDAGLETLREVVDNANCSNVISFHALIKAHFNDSIVLCGLAHVLASGMLQME